MLARIPWVGLLLSCCWSCGGSGGGSDFCEGQASQGPAAWLPREYPDDPPGIPAGSRLAPPGPHRPNVVRLGGFASVQVNVDSNGANIPGDAANEPSIAVDPTDPQRMAIGWRQFDTVTSNFRQAGWGYSQDGGETWTFGGVLEPGVFRSDPVLESDADGVFYYDSLEVVGAGTSEEDYSTDLFKSTDGGMTWSAPVFAFGGDKQWLAIDGTGGIGSGNLYSAWSALAGCCGCSTFNRSVDGGATFSIPSEIPRLPIYGTMAVGPLGEVYVGGVRAPFGEDFLVARSSDARDPSATPAFELTKIVELGGLFASDTNPNPDGLVGQVNVAVATGGPFAGAVHLLCSVDPPGPDPRDVHFARSTDGGLTWSAPVRVNDDPPGSDSWQWFGTLGVAPGGRIDAIWNDTRASGQARISELYCASSNDGGTTWSANQALSPPWDSHVGWPRNNKIGDYYDVVSEDTLVHVAWAATFNGEQDVYYLRVPR